MTPQAHTTTRSDPATAAAYAAALSAIDDGYVALADLDATLLSNTDRRDYLERLEKCADLAYARQYPLIRANVDQNAHGELGFSSPEGVTVDAVRCRTADARHRHRRAARVTGHTTPTGHKVPPQHPGIVATVTQGNMPDAHFSIIEAFEKYLEEEESVDREDFDWSMNQLGAVAGKVLPEQLQRLAKELTERLLPDGKLDDKKHSNKPWISIGKQKPNGNSGFRGEMSALMRSFLEPVFNKYGAPGALTGDGDPTDVTDTSPDADPAQPGLFDTSDDDGGDESCGDTTEQRDTTSDSDSDTDSDTDTADPAPTESTAEKKTPIVDDRTAAQRRHDALLHAIKVALGSGTLGTYRGMPVLPVVAIPLQNLIARTGYSRTTTGTTLAIADAIRMLAHAVPYLAVFDPHTHRTLYVGRAKRTATLDQRIALLMTDKGCSFPDCAAPASFCEVHHRNGDWADGGSTDITDLTFACKKHHRMHGTGPTQYRTSTAGPDHPYPGRTLWHHNTADPDMTDGRINHAHHPEDHLGT